MFERFTEHARMALQLASDEAQRLNQPDIGTEHIFLGLIKEDGGVAAGVLKNHGIDLVIARQEVKSIVKTDSTFKLDSAKLVMGKLPRTPQSKRVVDNSINKALSLNNKYVGTGHLLFSLLCRCEYVAVQVLINLGISLEEIRNEVLSLLEQNSDTDGDETINI